MSPGIDVRVADVDLVDAGRRRGCRPCSTLSTTSVVAEPHPTDEVPFRIGRGQGDDAAL